jgi:hypothetical protein
MHHTCGIETSLSSLLMPIKHAIWTVGDKPAWLALGNWRASSIWKR